MKLPTDKRAVASRILVLVALFAAFAATPLLAQNASVVPFGTGCGSSDVAPQLESSRPVLGKGVQIVATEFKPGGFVGLFFSLPTDTYTRIGNGCTLYFDVFSFIQAGPYMPDSTGMVYVPFTMPGDQILAGLPIVVQAVNVPQRSPVELTNALSWTLGY